MTAPIAFDNSYARLPAHFFARVPPAGAQAPRLIRLNRDLAVMLGLDPEWLAGNEGLEMLSGRAIAPGSEPIATAYAGHQFGSFVPQLGDGRAILLGEVLGQDGRRYDIQLKGGGRTPFSRGGDGRAAMGPVLREYVVSEAMAALGLPTTRALAAVATGEQVWREAALPGAVLTRVASSHIRVGTFQFFAVRGDTEAIRTLADHVTARHYPQAREAERPYLALLDAVIAAQAELVAGWMMVGFIHGVMNTDNMSVAGETIDYGPCAFMDSYHPATVFSSIDRMGRYAYANQPQIAQWNLARLAETLLPLLADEQEQAIALANDAIGAFPESFRQAHRTRLMRKLGLSAPRDDDDELAQAIFTAMADNQVDFTLFFRRLCEAALPDCDAEPLRSLFIDPTAGDKVLARWRARVVADPQEPEQRRAAMRSVNPAFIPRNHRIEAMIRAAVDNDDFAPFEELLHVLAKPYEDQPEFARYTEPPLEHERVLATFCGT